MTRNDLAIATISWARDEQEETLLREALQRLSTLNIPVFVTDGGSNNGFLDFLRALPNITIVPASGKGLWPQVKSSLIAAYESKASFILYTEPDKELFFQHGLSRLLEEATQEQQAGIILASRSASAFNTFPAFQKKCEETINFCCAEITHEPFDFTYGPFLLNRTVAAQMINLQQDIGWGWRPYAFCIAHLMGLPVQQVQGDFECPPDQRQDDAKERVYRMKQLHQNIEGVVLAAGVDLNVSK